MTAHPTEQGPASVPDFGRGSREQSQGGPSKDNVHAIRKLADAAVARD